MIKNKKIIIVFMIFLMAGCQQAQEVVPNRASNVAINQAEDVNINPATSKIPEHAMAHFQKGNVFLSQGEYQNAIQKYLLAIKVKEEFPQAHYNLGVAYFDSDRTQEAIKEWNQTLELDPEYNKAYLSLGYAYEKLKNNDKAVENYDKYLQLNPDDPNAAKISKRIYNLRGDLMGQGIIGRVVVTNKIDPKTHEPVQARDIFSDTSRKIFTTAEIGDAPPDTVIKVDWYYMGVKGEEIEVNSKEKIITGPQKMIFEIQSPTTRPWPPGRYEVRLFVNGKENLSVPFTVLKGEKSTGAPGKNT